VSYSFVTRVSKCGKILYIAIPKHLHQELSGKIVSVEVKVLSR